MNNVSPRQVFKEVAGQIPASARKHVTVIGSLAAGYALLRYGKTQYVRTKDVDCVLSPRIKAVETGRKIAEMLLKHGWRHETDGEFGKPGAANTPVNALPAVRLYPPNANTWFMELLSTPALNQVEHRAWTRLKLSSGYYGLPSFRFLSIATCQPELTEHGIYCARPEMMALANLLEHPDLSGERISTPLNGRTIRRCNKDLGRVLAIARLSTAQDEDALLAWPETWIGGLRKCLPKKWRELAPRMGAGMRALLASPNDFDEAYHTCMNGLLADVTTTREQLRMSGLRLIRDAIETTEHFKTHL